MIDIFDFAPNDDELTDELMKQAEEADKELRAMATEFPEDMYDDLSDLADDLSDLLPEDRGKNYLRDYFL